MSYRIAALSLWSPDADTSLKKGPETQSNWIVVEQSGRKGRILQLSLAGQVKQLAALYAPASLRLECTLIAEEARNLRDKLPEGATRFTMLAICPDTITPEARFTPAQGMISVVAKGQTIRLRGCLTARVTAGRPLAWRVAAWQRPWVQQVDPLSDL